MRKIISTALAAILVFTLFACGAPAQGDTEDTEATAAQTGETTSSADTAEAATDVTTEDVGGEELEAKGHYIYDHVIVVGVDGAGAFFKDADTPNFDRIFKDGCVTYKAYTSNPSGSAQAWGSMLTGTAPGVHGLTNDIAAEEIYPSDSPFPSVFKRISNVRPDARLGVCVEWGPIFDGMVETDIEVIHRGVSGDDNVAAFTADYVKKLKPVFSFTQFDSADAYGHNNGYGSPAHLERISLLDGYMGQIYDSAVNSGIIDSTLFIVIADHGGTYDVENGIGGHGGWSDEEKYVTFAAVGKNVKTGEMGYVNVRDLSAVVLYALGIEAPEFDADGWTSQVPENLFDESDVPPYDRSIYADDGKDAEQ